MNSDERIEQLEERIESLNQRLDSAYALIKEIKEEQRRMSISYTMLLMDIQQLQIFAGEAQDRITKLGKEQTKLIENVSMFINPL